MTLTVFLFLLGLGLGLRLVERRTLRAEPALASHPETRTIRWLVTATVLAGVVGTTASAVAAVWP